MITDDRRDLVCFSCGIYVDYVGCSLRDKLILFIGFYLLKSFVIILEAHTTSGANRSVRGSLD